MQANTTRKPPRPLRAKHGAWTGPAKEVYVLVTKRRWNVSDAVRQVIADRKIKDPAKAFRGIRAAYYLLRNREAATEDFKL